MTNGFEEACEKRKKRPVSKQWSTNIKLPWGNLPLSLWIPDLPSHLSALSSHHGCSHPLYPCEIRHFPSQSSLTESEFGLCSCSHVLAPFKTIKLFSSFVLLQGSKLYFSSLVPPPVPVLLVWPLTWLKHMFVTHWIMDTYSGQM